MTDLFLRIERMYHTACDLDLNVGYLASALQSLHAGRFDDAHMALYLGDWTSAEPAGREFTGMVFELEPVGKRRKGRAA